MSDLIIRRAVPEDIETIHRFANELWQFEKNLRTASGEDPASLENPEIFAEHSANYDAALLHQDTDQTWACRIADVGGRAVGYALAKIAGQNRPDTTPKAIMYEMFVDQAHRRSGAGRALETDIARWAVTQGAGGIALLAIRQNQPASRFYNRLGYRNLGPIGDGKAHMYFRPLVDLE